METCEPEMLFSEEELAELLKRDASTGASEVGCYGN